MAERTWERRELPILEAIAEADAAGEDVRDSDALAEHTGLTEADLAAGLRGLVDAEMVAGVEHVRRRYALAAIHLRERGRRVVGQWPSEDPYDELLAIIERRILEADDPQERDRLRRLKNHILDVGKGVVSALLYELLRGGIR